MRPPNVYQINSEVVISVGFTDVATGLPTDPTTVSLYVKFPDGSEQTYGVDDGVTKDSTGNYHLDLPVTVPGGYYYKWAGTGSVITTSPDAFFRVQGSALIN